MIHEGLYRISADIKKKTYTDVVRASRFATFTRGFRKIRIRGTCGNLCALHGPMVVPCDLLSGVAIAPMGYAIRVIR